MSRFAKPDPALQSAIRHHQAGRLDKAESIYRQVLARQPSQPDALHQLGILSARQGKMDEAEQLFRRAIDAKPNFADALANLANVQITREQYADAAASLEKSLAIQPRNPIALSNLSFALRWIGRFEEAADAARKSLALVPDRPDTLNNLGSALEELGQFDEANNCYRRALARDPSAAAIHLNLAHGLLRAGDYAGGWNEYEWRWKNPSFRDAQRAFPERMWDGNDLTGQSIFLYAEQGIGDTIQFLRYVPLVKPRGGAGRVILEVQPLLKRLCESIDGVDELIAAAPGDRPIGDVRCPLLSLPLKLNLIQEKDIPRQVPYLRARDPGLRGDAQTPACERSEDADRSRLRVGLLVSGNPKFKRNAERSVPADALAPLRLLADRIDFVSLKKRDPDAPADLPFPMTDPTDRLSDFADTASLIASLDVVITVDSAVAHLSGAMGKETWLMLSLLRDWRWPMEGESSIWYPTMRVFRQETRGDWRPVVERVAGELLTRVKSG